MFHPLKAVTAVLAASVLFPGATEARPRYCDEVCDCSMPTLLRCTAGVSTVVTCIEWCGPLLDAPDDEQASAEQHPSPDEGALLTCREAPQDVQG
ncbi:hypothetical protein [Corallococcus macrosporus]|uniref:Uncharacterized protein n=2 Tax=Myxococcaceae TaxID=31 RepID=A0A250JWM7_9BACT|nr:hypothetical protein [Corallococcus macrosporus]AEI67493.1 hypothetical protein LILAB_28030 [Corallococcus macrosporus]ATB48269.1 hypothetical protein MYMAC_003895 [Corallococcus macrosporus DSM 14697]